MKINRFLLLAALALSGCALPSPQQKGTMTPAMTGTKVLSEKGSPLDLSGVYAKREVPPDWAAGYEAGLSDSVKRDYWAVQAAAAAGVR